MARKVLCDIFWKSDKIGPWKFRMCKFSPWDEYYTNQTDQKINQIIQFQIQTQTQSLVHISQAQTP